MARLVRVFISYSHKDDALRDQLRAHLSQLERDGLVQSWDDRAIPAGSQWADEIDERLNQADVILLLVSADFIRSDYCYRKEMGRALERHAAQDDHAIVVPVILRKCDWQTAPFAKLQALPPDARPISQWKTKDDYFEVVAKGLRQRIESLAPPAAGAAAHSSPTLATTAGNNSFDALVASVPSTGGEPVASERSKTPHAFVQTLPRGADVRAAWRRPGLLAALAAGVLAATSALLWWRASASEVGRAVQQAVALFSVGIYGEAQAPLEPACRRWLVGGPACFALDKARLGGMLEASGDTLPVEKSQQALEQLRRSQPAEDPDLLLFSGALELNTTDPERRPNAEQKAVADFNRALELRTNFHEAWYRLGALKLMNARRSEDFAQARVFFDRAIGDAGDPDGTRSKAPHYFNARAYARLQLGDLAGAEADYRQSIDGLLILSRIELAELLWRKGDFAAAADQQRRAMEELAQSPPSGRNAQPWTIELRQDASLTLKSVQEKMCYARLAWQASKAVLGEAKEPDRADCGAQGSNIAKAVAWSLERVFGNRLPMAAESLRHTR